MWARVWWPHAFHVKRWSKSSRLSKASSLQSGVLSPSPVRSANRFWDERPVFWPRLVNPYEPAFRACLRLGPLSEVEPKKERRRLHIRSNPLYSAGRTAANPPPTPQSTAKLL
jgi:hypothetical protein